MNKAVSDHMRQMQRLSADARWSGLPAAERKAKMSALAKARWAKRPKTKRARLRPNDKVSDPALTTRSSDMLKAKPKLKGRAGSLNRIVVLRRLVNRLGEALDEQQQRWGLYGNESQDALTAFKRFKAQHNDKLTDPATR